AAMAAFPSDYVRRPGDYIRLVLISNQTNVRCGDINFFSARGTNHRNLRFGFLYMSASTTQMMTVLFSGFTQPDNEAACLKR
ncbi:hypothetical protein ABTM78_21220, partial [Acinetobacter baumannii]